jgi:hypothetical protein
MPWCSMTAARRWTSSTSQVSRSIVGRASLPTTSEVKRSPKGKKSGPVADFTKGRVKIVPVSLRLVAAANE